VAGDKKNYICVMLLIEEQKLKEHLDKIKIWLIFLNALLIILLEQNIYKK
jgi:hypothetical protein